MKHLIISTFLVTLTISNNLLASEAELVKEYCWGEVERRNSDNTRTDCYSHAYSGEFDFAPKWYECITQALHYAFINKNSAICVLMLKKPADIKYVLRARRLIEYYRLPVLLDMRDPQ